jgi:hypothetical protein
MGRTACLTIYRWPWLLAIVLLALSPIQAQSTPKLEFDVASVKLNTFGAVSGQNPPMTNVDLDPGDIFVPTGGVFSVRNKSLRTLIAFAYKMSGDSRTSSSSMCLTSS